MPKVSWLQRLSRLALMLFLLNETELSISGVLTIGRAKQDSEGITLDSVESKQNLFTIVYSFYREND